MHTSPTSLTCALNIIREADLSELPVMKDCITNNLLADIAANSKRPPTGDTMLDEVRGWVDEARVKSVTEDKLRILKSIVSRQQASTKPVAGGITPAMIERAREYPIRDLYNGNLRGGMGKCPFHEDKTASLSFRRYNRFRCFGCEAKGSVIDYYMKINNVNFIQAVKALQ